MRYYNNKGTFRIYRRDCPATITLSGRVSSISDNCVLQCRLAGKKAHSWPSESSLESSLATTWIALRQSFFRGRSLFFAFTRSVEEKDDGRILCSSIFVPRSRSPTTFDSAMSSVVTVVVSRFPRVSASAITFLSFGESFFSLSLSPQQKLASAVSESISTFGETSMV